MTSDTKRKTNSTSTVPLPIPSHTFIKIEDCSGTTSNGASTSLHQTSSAIYEHEKSIQTASATIHTNELPQNMTAQFLYQHPGNLIHIGPAPHHPSHSITPATIMEATIHDYRTTATSPTLQPPPLIPTLMTTTAAQLTPPPERCDSMDREQITSGSMPEVQDANIQTDTPIMSEDDNTTGTEGVPSIDVNNEESNDATTNAVQATNYETMCHSNDSNNASNENVIESTGDLNSESVETTIENNGDIVGQISNMSTPAPVTTKSEPLVPVKYNSPLMNILPPEHMVQIQGSFRPPPQDQPVDLSGLELLSNSIEVFQKKSIIKKEPVDLRENVEFRIPSPTITESDENKQNECDAPIAKQTMELVTTCHQLEESYVGNDEPMGGLNLLCALAEQRFQEEVDQRNKTVSNPSSDPASDEFELKRHKHKHSSSKKSSKKSRHDREKHRSEKDQLSKKRTLSSDENNMEEEEEEEEAEEDLGREVQHSLMRVKAKYDKKCNCVSTEEQTASNTHHCCHTTNWPTPSELISVMETDMKEHLANIMRQCQEKKRELDEMSPLLKNIKQQAKHALPETTIKPTYFGGPASNKLSLIPALSPSFSSSSNSDSTLVELPKLSSDTDSSKFEDAETSSVERLSTSKRKGGNPKRHDDIALTETIVAKKPKSLVGYILASKNKVADSNVKEMIYTKGAVDERICKKSKLSPSCKSESFSFSTTDDASCLSDSSFRANTAKVTAKQEAMQTEDDDNSKPLSSFAIFGEKPFRFEMNKHESKSSKHHSKHKKSRSSKDGKHRRLSEKKRIDTKCMLTPELLEKDKIRVLTSMGGLFYAGCLSALQPPDVYAVTLDGERGNRPHIMSQEEILRDAVSLH